MALLLQSHKEAIGRRLVRQLSLRLASCCSGARGREERRYVAEGYGLEVEH